MQDIRADSLKSQTLEGFGIETSFHLGVYSIHLYVQGGTDVGLTVEISTVGINDHSSIKFEDSSIEKQKLKETPIGQEISSVELLSRKEWYEPVEKEEGIIGNNPRQLNWAEASDPVPEGIDAFNVIYAVEIQFSDSADILLVELDDNYYPDLMMVSWNGANLGVKGAMPIPMNAMENDKTVRRVKVSYGVRMLKEIVYVTAFFVLTTQLFGLAGQLIGNVELLGWMFYPFGFVFTFVFSVRFKKIFLGLDVFLNSEHRSGKP